MNPFNIDLLEECPMIRLHRFTSRVVWLLATLSLTISIASARGETPAENPAPRKLDGLGTHTRKISTRSSEAQAFFDQGLVLLYGFNHDEAIRSFQHAARLDPECAMPHWAIALANGPHINSAAVDETHAKAAWTALTRARELVDKASPIEQDLIEALGKRYADPQPADRKPLDAAYANAMRELWARYPTDADVGALFAESLMDLRPWDLWTKEKKPQPGTAEIVQTLEAVITMSPRHPLALHLYIHAVEASPYPEKAAASADTLRDLVPGVGHLVHMPSHIDVLLGHWQRAIVANEKAIKVDTAYRRAVPRQNFYRIYMAHNHHMLALAAMMQGESRRATEAVDEMLSAIPQDWLKDNAPGVDSFFAMPYELHMRFGRWDEMLGEPEPAEYLPVSRAVRLYGRGVALAAKNQIAEAKQEQARFLAAKNALPKEATFGLNTAENVLAVAENMLAGEILYREGKVDEAVAALRDAVAREQQLRYNEPPDWIQPVRHALGATLMDAQRHAEAEEVYRADLEQYRENGWSLFGLAESLKMQEKHTEAADVEARFQAVWKHADVKLTSSCYCLPGKE